MRPLCVILKIVSSSQDSFQCKLIAEAIIVRCIAKTIDTASQFLPCPSRVSGSLHKNSPDTDVYYDYASGLFILPDQGMYSCILL